MQGGRVIVCVVLLTVICCDAWRLPREDDDDALDTYQDMLEDTREIRMKARMYRYFTRNNYRSRNNNNYGNYNRNHGNNNNRVQNKFGNNNRAKNNYGNNNNRAQNNYRSNNNYRNYYGYYG